VGMNSTDLLPEAAELDARTIGLGAVYSPTDQLQFSLGYTNVNYDSVTTDATTSRAPAGSKLEKDVWAISFGAQYRWF
jgi:long-subunit fatty acid transport protein